MEQTDLEFDIHTFKDQWMVTATRSITVDDWSIEIETVAINLNSFRSQITITPKFVWPGKGYHTSPCSIYTTWGNIITFLLYTNGDMESAHIRAEHAADKMIEDTLQKMQEEIKSQAVAYLDMIRSTRRNEICPLCGADLDEGSIFETLKKQNPDVSDLDILNRVVSDYGPPYRWSRLMGIEIRGKGDRIAYFECPDCKGKIERK